jgi:GNAT superfamily N-acetyltransferase
MVIRPAQEGDEVAIMSLIQALAEYEKAPTEVVNSAPELRKHLFEENICDAIVAIEKDSIIGFALYYTNYSTWKGKCLYLEDFFVLPEYRGAGIGSELFDEVVKIAKLRGVKRMDWQVLDWNEPALNFYKKKNAVLDPQWINGRFFFE